MVEVRIKCCTGELALKPKTRRRSLILNDGRRKVRNLVAQRRVANRLMTVPTAACAGAIWPWRLKSTEELDEFAFFQGDDCSVITSTRQVRISTSSRSPLSESNQSSMQVAQEIFYISLLNSFKSIAHADPTIPKLTCFVYAEINAP